MDDIILIIFATFTLMLMLIGFFKRQVILTVFSGIGFVLIGVFILQGVTYTNDATFVDANFTTTNMIQHTSVWHSAYAIPIFFFLVLFGVALVIISVLEYRSGGKKHPLDGVNDNEDEE